jgi:hypothetical protein
MLPCELGCPPLKCRHLRPGSCSRNDCREDYPARSKTSAFAFSISSSGASSMPAMWFRAFLVARISSSSFNCRASVSRLCVAWIRKTIKNVTIVVPVLMTSCQVSLKPRAGDRPNKYDGHGQEEGRWSAGNPRGRDSQASEPIALRLRRCRRIRYREVCNTSWIVRISCTHQ